MAAPENSNGRARRLARPADVTTPFVRAREFMNQPVPENIDQRPDELPLARPTLAVARQVFHDELVLLGFRLFLPVGGAGALDRATARSVRRLSITRSMDGWTGRKGSLPPRRA